MAYNASLKLQTPGRSPGRPIAGSPTPQEAARTSTESGPQISIWPYVLITALDLGIPVDGMTAAHDRF
jgi:hypothetical protein